MALHEQSVGSTDNWFTPPRIFKALGCTFDIDVASPGRAVTPWIPAHAFITANSLSMKWDGFVWMNAPFGARMGLVPWLEKFIEHANGICLVPDRTSCPWFQSWFPAMELVLIVGGKIKFINVDGVPGKSPAQGTCLGGIGDRGREALHRAAANGLGVLARPLT
jgi:DNA N-6-adenine-methyltransferase (Dam)